MRRRELWSHGVRPGILALEFWRARLHSRQVHGQKVRCRGKFLVPTPSVGVGQRVPVKSAFTRSPKSIEVQHVRFRKLPVVRQIFPRHRMHRVILREEENGYVSSMNVLYWINLPFGFLSGSPPLCLRSKKAKF